MTAILITPAIEWVDISSSFWRMNVARYHEMIQKDVLTTNDRLELLEGFLIEKTTVNPFHAFVTETINDVLSHLCTNGRFVNAQQLYWIVNLPDRQIEVYTEPSGVSANPTYRNLITYQEDDEIPVAVDGGETAVFSVRDLLP